MSRGTSGLSGDLEVLRRRAWLFIPFGVAGLAAALFIGSFSGEYGAVAQLSLDTSVHDLVAGGDRGLRIYEAQQMTGDPRFREKVVQATGHPDFNFGRFSIGLVALTVAEGTSRGVLTIGIRDPDKALAERYREAFVSVFVAEFTAKDGLWRTRFLETRRRTADETAAKFDEVYRRLKARTDPLGVYLPPLLEHRGWSSPGLADYQEQASLRRQLADVRGALEAIKGIPEGAAAAVAASALGQPVPAGDATAALTARKKSLESALAEVRENPGYFPEEQLDLETQRLLDEARSLRIMKDEANARLANALIAVNTAEGFVAASYSSSGSRAGSLPGRIAVALAITIVCGLIAIYAVEWLSPGRPSPDE